MTAHGCLKVSSLCSLFSLFPLLIAGPGCSSSSSSLAPPSQLTVKQSEWDFDQVMVSWTPPSGTVSGYELQGRVGSGPWEGLDDQIPADVVGGILSLAPSIPELTEIRFRIRSVKGGKQSAWSDEVVHQRILRWPLSITSSAVPEGMLLGWTNTSTAATGVRVSRQFGSQWQVLADLPPTATSFLDATLLEADVPIAYRLAATTGATVGSPGVHYSAGYPATPVYGLTATTEAGGVHLRWSAPPISNQTFVVHMAAMNAGPTNNPVTPAPLPASATEFLHAAPPGVHRYEVESRFTTPGSTWPRTVVVGLANPTGLPALEGTIRRLPGASFVARDSQGRFAFARGGGGSPYALGPMDVVFRGTGAAPDHDFGTAHGWSSPPVVFDLQDHPHVGLVRPVAADPSVAALVHAWHDGTAWNEEEVVKRAFDEFEAIRFARDAGGGMHLAWSSQAGAGFAEYARRDPAGWTVEDLAPTLGLPARVMGLEVDGPGVPTILASSGSNVVLLRRAPAWTVETIPGTKGSRGMNATHGGIGIIQHGCEGTFPDLKCQHALQERTAAGWAPASALDELVESPVYPPRDDFTGLCDSLDGSRRALWFGYFGSGAFADWHLKFREGAQPWTMLDTGMENGPVVAWFSPSGKLGLLFLAGMVADANGETGYVEYLEP